MVLSFLIRYSISSSALLPSNFPVNETYAPVYVMRKLVCSKDCELSLNSVGVSTV